MIAGNSTERREHYYDIVAKKYRDTGLSGPAGERLAALEGKPSQPPQRLAWLANAFPDSEDKPLLVNQPGVYLR